MSFDILNTLLVILLYFMLKLFYSNILIIMLIKVNKG